MNTALFYDTETTGLPLFKEPSDDPRQPHLVQLAAALVDLDTREIISSMDVIIRPEGWTIPDDVVAVHGISTEKAQQVGIFEELALEMFTALWQRAHTRIGHNEQFDARIIRIGLKRLEKSDFKYSRSNLWKEGVAECTANLTTPILRLPPTAKMAAVGLKKCKTPKLSEAYEYFFNKPLEGAHNAMVDVKGCIDVYFAAKDFLAEQASNLI